MEIETDETQTCETCPFWVRYRDKDGTCRFHAPPLISQVDVLSWPGMPENDWCGQHPYRFRRRNGQGPPGESV